MKYKFILEGINPPAFKNQNDGRKKKRVWEILMELEIDSELSKKELTPRKYEFVVRHRYQIKEKYNFKVPLRISKIRWRIEEIDGNTPE